MGTTEELRELVGEWGSAFAGQDLDACVDLFSPDATLKFLFATYQGRDAIRQWHADRFAAGARIVSLDAVEADGDVAVARVEATSKRLRFFKIDKVKGEIKILAREGRFVEVRFSPRKGAYSHLNWQFQ